MTQDTAGRTQLEELGARIWRWRAEFQPRTRDDIPRLDRPDGWLPDWRADTVGRIALQRNGFAAELDRLDPGPDVADRIDAHLLRSLLSRVHWELDIVAAWRRQPRFYLDQALGTVFDALLRPGVDAARIHEVARLLDAAPDILAQGRANLSGFAYREFVDLALAELADIDERCAALADALAPYCRRTDRPDELRAQLIASAGRAADALARFASALAAQRDSCPQWSPIGTEHYSWFLREVAVLPFSPEGLRAIGALELDRAITLELLARNRIGATAAPAPAATAELQAAREAELEEQVRRFYTRHDLLSQPADLRHYRNAPMPAYLEPLRFLGVSDDLTSPSRLAEDAVSYVPEPTGDLPYFYAANALDPRAGIVHEGAHYQQLALSWRNPRPLRRHFYDSTPNEGIAFYNEEMLLAAGLFADAPATTAVIYNFMRLRALRVTVDVGLATGALSIPEAARYLETEVGMDAATAAEEAAAFAEGPGQAISYQIGKTQILGILADTARVRGSALSLREVHDYLWRNGNVPLALLRWEFLGLTDDLERLGVASSSRSAVLRGSAHP